MDNPSLLTSKEWPTIFLATIDVNFSNLDALKFDNVDIISASTQSGQSPSPQKRNF